MSLRLIAPTVLAAGLAIVIGAGIWQIAVSWRDAGRGLLIFASNQKDLIIDTDLVERSYTVRNDPDAVKQLRRQTVIVATSMGNHRVYMGAGVIVSQRNGMLTILTAKHLVAHPGRHLVIFDQRLGRYGRRVRLSSSGDLATIEVRAIPGISYRVAHLASTELSSGQSFTVMGHPGSREWFASPGVAEHHRSMTLLFCPTCDRGDSGAGAFTANGRLSGIVVKKARIAIPSFGHNHGAVIIAFEIEQLQSIRQFLKAERIST